MRNFRSNCSTSSCPHKPLEVPKCEEKLTRHLLLLNLAIMVNVMRKLGKKTKEWQLWRTWRLASNGASQTFLSHIYTFFDSPDRDELNALLLTYVALIFAEKNDHACLYIFILFD